MKLVLTGGTGFIGQALAQALLQERHDLTVLTHQPPKASASGSRLSYLHWNPDQKGAWEDVIGSAEGIINLAGEPVATRWTTRKKDGILGSRVETTRAIVRAMGDAQNSVKILINASAVGYYGDCGNQEPDESAPPGKGFLAEVCRRWESEASLAEKSGHRVVIMRFGIVLGNNGGMLKKMLLPFRYGLGGSFGTGRQWISWIHRTDLIGLILFALKNPLMRGGINATAPGPVTMKEFSDTLGKILKRPARLPVPSFLLRLALGEAAGMLLSGQKVLPGKALRSGYVFLYPSLREALENCLSGSH
ncbi:MAG TPA: TIGR01777 family oxidoreductase [Candidatus Omnitrophota bacterium]|nr:TIGR01777 family oxidoreductase [Candidatus Omnitrophota bacterium]